jgi:arylsulfatase A-like enzyme/lipopolysaccharide biosynthesis regulator YciM
MAASSTSPRRKGAARRAATVLGLVAAAILVASFLFRALTPAPPTTGAKSTAAGLLGETPPGELNVILITIDTLRADRLSCYGSQRITTPSIDNLAGEGARFANAASTVPFTLPAHSSIMTGTYPPYHGVRENVGYFLDETLPTLAERLAAGGWATAGFVSAFVLDSRWGIARGFETFYDDFDLEGSKTANLGSVQRDGRLTVAEAVRWLDSGKAREPFFLWLHLFDPHDPYKPPEPFRSQYPGHPYDAEVAYADSLIGEFRAALDSRGLLDRSLLILTGDHGEGLGQHQEGFHGFFVYDSTVRVPLILRAPGGSFSGRVVEEVVSHVDILPTVLEATGLEIPEHAQGSSLLSVLGADREKDDPGRYVYSESLYPLLHYGWAPLRSIRSRQHKFIEAPQPELYDLAADPGETENVLLDQRRTSRRLKDALDTMVTQIESGARSAQPADLDEETLRQLQALGYVAGRGGVAADEAQQGERADPKDRIQLHQLVMAAQSSIGAGDPEQAEGRLLEVLASDPRMLEAHQMLGTIESQREQYEKAADHFRAALEQRDDHTPSLWGLANAYRKMGRTEEALVGYRRLLELDPADTKVVLALADLLVQQNNRSEAIGLLREATSGESPPPVLLSRLGELGVADGRAEEAAELFERALAGNDKLAPASFNLAVLYEEQGRIEEAVALYQRAVEQAPAHYQAMFNLGRLYGRRGDVERQEALWEQSIEANPGFARGYFFLAKSIMDRGGNLVRAEELARAGLNQDPEHRAGPLGYFLLADILNRRGRSAEAHEAASKAREIQRAGGV